MRKSVHHPWHAGLVFCDFLSQDQGCNPFDLACSKHKMELCSLRSGAAEALVGEPIQSPVTRDSCSLDNRHDHWSNSDDECVIFQPIALHQRPVVSI